MTRLVLGPLLRHVSANSATLWVETDRPCAVVVRTARPALEHTAPTFTVHGHHYALVEVGGLDAGSDTTYEVSLDGERVWPEEGDRLPPSRIRTPGGDHRVRVSFGSCRRSPGSDADHGPDALISYAHRLAAGLTDGAAGTGDAADGGTGDAADDGEWPNALLMIGDQVYADELSSEIRDFIRTRREPGEEPQDELADFEDYTELYRLAWGADPVVRWLLSTVPTLTIFDDHDIRDDWNTSHRWRQQMWAKPWWRRRIVGGLGSYWIYQHLGNLPPHERATDPLYAAIREAEDGGELLDAFAERADQQPGTARWSYAQDFGGTRLIVVDSRASRLLTADRRAMLDDHEARWLSEQCEGDFEHLLIGSSLPYLLPRTIHHAEGWNEAVAGGAWGRRAAHLGEKVRQGADLEHWAAFERSFREVAQDVLAVARGDNGRPPAGVSFLSGDIHYSYLAKVTTPATEAPIHQIVCSPLRNPLLGRFRWANRLACTRWFAVPFWLLARLARVPKPPLKWRITKGPWFDNAIATVEVDGRAASVRWETPDGATALTELGHAALAGRPRVRP